MKMRGIFFFSLSLSLLRLSPLSVSTSGEEERREK
jgi:hypothetical protein